MSPTQASKNSSEPRWFILLMASRWPLAVILGTWAIAVAAIQILRQPIPIGLPMTEPFPVRLEGGITVNKIMTPITVKAETPLPISASKPLPLGEAGVVVKSPVQVQASSSLPVTGSVAVNTIKTPVTVDKIQSAINVDGIVKPISVQSEEPLSVTTGDDPLAIKGKVMLENPLKSISPLPLP